MWRERFDKIADTEPVNCRATAPRLNVPYTTLQTRIYTPNFVNVVPGWWIRKDTLETHFNNDMQRIIDEFNLRMPLATYIPDHPFYFDEFYELIKKKGFNYKAESLKQDLHGRLSVVNLYYGIWVKKTVFKEKYRFNHKAA